MSDNALESTMEEILAEKRENGIFVISINRPAKRNALTADMAAEMTRLFRAADDDEDTRVIILRGEGGFFCAGGDMNAAVTADSPEAGRILMGKYGTAIKTMQSIDKPIICEVEGYAIGAGFSFALASDIIYAAEDAYFTSNFLHLGTPPECGAMVFLPLSVGPYRAKELWYTARKITATEAEDKYGFVSKVCEPDKLDEDTMEIANMISGLPSCSARITKRFTNDFTFPMLDAVLSTEMQNTPFCVGSEESQALFLAFLKKKQHKAAEENS
ncbi:MAG: enoyl-CoA hydratase/isomerase family protein [Coriobacteriales bacterium]|jgi:2-(1,2-epoxy-1,2-dihydrophenyl)acetyl-CoA isomerase